MQTAQPVTSHDQSTIPAAEEPAPSLQVSNEKPPEVLYRRGSRDHAENEMRRTPERRPARIETIVTRKVGELTRDLEKLQRAMGEHSTRLTVLQANSEVDASRYYQLVSEMSAQLQSGTTPGNPYMVEKWSQAQERLNALSENGGKLNELGTDIASDATLSTFLLEGIRAAYRLSGAVEEDHEQLMSLEDQVNQTISLADRLLTDANDEISRRTAYLRSERLNMQTISLAIANGELYGQSLANSHFTGRSAITTGPTYPAGRQASGNPSFAPPSANRRPLVIIRFDRADVDYQQAVYMAVSQALEKQPDSRFDLVAVSPTITNAAQAALESNKARRNGEDVLRTLTQMGLPLERINLSASTSKNAANSEVHIYLQ